MAEEETKTVVSEPVEAGTDPAPSIEGGTENATTVEEEQKTQIETMSAPGEEIAPAEKVPGVEEQAAPDEQQVEPEISAPAVGADQAVPVVAEAADEVQLAAAPVEEAVPAAATGLGKGIETLIEVVNNSAASDAVAAGNGAEASVAAPVTAMQVAVAGSKQPKRRGRPPKPIPEGALSSIPKRRGRPPKKIEMEVKVAGVPPEASAPVEAAGAQPATGTVPIPPEVVAGPEEPAVGKKRGRPRGPLKEETAAEAVAPKKRGRPALADKDKAPAALPAKAAQKLVGVQLET